jgi:hypothetical protein
LSIRETEVSVLNAIQYCRSYLSTQEITQLNEFASVGEPGLAVETLCEILLDRDVTISMIALTSIAAAGRLMGLDPAIWKRLSIDKA